MQPGATLREINTALAAVGRRFAPNPACLECTAGGMLATNASGSRALHHGYTRDHVESLRVVLDTGDAVAVARERRQSILREANPDSSVAVPLPMPRLDDIVTSLATLLERRLRPPSRAARPLLSQVRSSPRGRPARQMAAR